MKNKRVLITGGSGDLATGIYNTLSEAYTVVAPNKAELDVTSVDSVENYFRDNFFDIVINCAGTLYSSLVIDSNPRKWIRDIEVNLIGSYLICRASLINNKKTTIVNISSTAAFNSYKDWTSYCAAKSGVLKLSLGLVKDGYTIITLCPGAIDTKLRNGLNIENKNVMSLSEGIKPILSAVNGEFNSGDIVFYRKGLVNILREDDLE